MNSPERDAAVLLQFNRQLLEQALELVTAHDAPDAPAYSSYAGAHVRHVIEHYEALLFAPLATFVDYDARSRDRALEQSTALARARLLRLAQRLIDWPAITLAAPIRVQTRGGLFGEIEFSNLSTVGRELVFLASHAVHHFALLQVYCLQHGISMRPNFGEAPATVAHGLRS
jgi:hypothetical protein